MPSLNENRVVLLFDIGGVLTINHTQEQLAAMMDGDTNRNDLKSFWLDSPAVRRFELGKCTPEQFSAAILAELRLNIKVDKFLKSFRNWANDIDERASELLAALRKHYIVCCLSNSNELHWNKEKASHFHYAFFSHIIGSVKPDIEAFRYVLRRINLRPDEIYFFDDSKKNVETARSLGIDAYEIKGLDELTEKLRQLELYN